MSLSKPIVIEALSQSELIRQRWVFQVMGHRILLDRYFYERRHSKGQVFKTTKFYDRRHDGENYGDWTWLTEAEVPWDEELRVDVAAAMVARFEVVRESEVGVDPDS